MPFAVFCACRPFLSSRGSLPSPSPNPLTSWQIHSHPSGCSSSVSAGSPHLPSTHLGDPGIAPSHGHALTFVPAPLWPFLPWSDVPLPREGICPLPQLGSQSQQGSEWGRLGLGLGGQKWKLPSWHLPYAGLCAGHFTARPGHSLSHLEVEPGSSLFAEESAGTTEAAQAPLPPGSAHPEACAWNHE